MAGVDSAAKDATSEHLLAPAAAALDESAFSGRVFAHGSVPGHSQTHNQRLRQGGATSYRRRGGTSHRSTSSAVAASVIGGGDSFSVASDANRSATRARLAQQESRIGDSASTNSPVTAATDADTGETLLHLAAQAGSATLVSALLRAGADSAAVDALGRTPLDLAAAALERTAGSPASARYDATVRALAHGGSLHVRLQNNAMDTTGTLAIDAAPSLSAADRRMLVDAFTALSLRDKCAVSLALGTAPPSAPPTTLAPATTLGAGATALATPSSPPQRDRGGVASGGGYIASGSASHSRGHHRSLSETGSTDDPQSLHAHAQAQAMLRSLRLDAPTPAADTSKRKRVEDALAEPAQSELEPMPPGPRAAINVPTSETQSVAHALALMSAEEVLVRAACQEAPAAGLPLSPTRCCRTARPRHSASRRTSARGSSGATSGSSGRRRGPSRRRSGARWRGGGAGLAASLAKAATPLLWERLPAPRRSSHCSRSSPCAP